MTTNNLETTFWLATPVGTSAIAVTVLEGPNADELISRFFHSIHGKRKTGVPIGKFRYGRWRSCQDSSKTQDATEAELAGEDLIVCRIGREQFEIHSHGGRIATNRIANDLKGQGARQTTWQDHLLATQPWYRAWPQMAFQQAPTLRTATLLDQQRDNWNRLAEVIGSRELNTTTLVETLKGMLAWEWFGLHLLRPRKLALFGPPNSGKSSLMNRLGGFERSIIHDLPGTTRDVVSQSTAIDGWPLEILDTAGLREGTDNIERQGIEFARKAVSTASLRLLVLDAANIPCDVEFESLMGLQPDLVIWNKLDLPTQQSRPSSNSICVSALTGQGLAELIVRIGELLIREFPESELAIPLNEVMSGKLREAIDLAERQDWSAIQRLFSGDTDPAADPSQLE